MIFYVHIVDITLKQLPQRFDLDQLVPFKI
jgi:hypothetical protein